MALRFDGNNILDGNTLVARLDEGGEFATTKAGRSRRIEIAALVAAQNPMDPASAAPKDTALQSLVDAAKGLRVEPEMRANPAPIEMDNTPDPLVGGVDWSKAPERDPEMGDKTPAFVEWVRKHYPDEFVRRYRNRITHLTHE